MRRHRLRKQAVGMSLFSFLAVLICTMGALIVLVLSGLWVGRTHFKRVLHKAWNRDAPIDDSDECTRRTPPVRTPRALTCVAMSAAVGA